MRKRSLLAGAMALLLGPALFAGVARAGDGPTPWGDGSDGTRPGVGVTDPGHAGQHSPGGGGGGGGGVKTLPNGCPDTPGVSYPWARPLEPQPPKSDPIWQGHTTGGIYSEAGWCKDGQVLQGPAIFWLPRDPDAAPVVDPAQLARQALAAIRIPRPVLHRSPTEANVDNGMPYTWVNLWTWYWTDPAIFTDRERSVSLGGVTATVRVRATGMTFAPGGGARASTCAGPGRAWTQADGNAAPSGGGCGVRYRQVSTAVTSALTVHWEATWTSSTGAGGTLPVADTQTTSRFAVQQIQVVSR